MISLLIVSLFFFSLVKQYGVRSRRRRRRRRRLFCPLPVVSRVYFCVCVCFACV